MRTDIRRKPKLHGQFRNAIRVRHYRVLTEKTYWYWIPHFIRVHRMHHPSEITEPQVSAFLTKLASERDVTAATQNQALNVRLFFYIASSLSWHATALPNIPHIVSHAPASIPATIDNSN